MQTETIIIHEAKTTNAIVDDREDVAEKMKTKRKDVEYNNISTQQSTTRILKQEWVAIVSSLLLEHFWLLSILILFIIVILCFRFEWVQLI